MSELFECVAKGDLEALRSALDTASEDEARGVLVVAAERGEQEIVKLLTERGVFDPWAIVSASSFGRLSVVRYLAGHGGGNLKAALIGAAAHGETGVVKFLTSRGADGLNEALADAALRGYSDIVKHLTECGADMNAPVYNGETAVSLAWKRGHKDVCAYFSSFRKE